jgi:hypothetical protein
LLLNGKAANQWGTIAFALVAAKVNWGESFATHGTLMVVEFGVQTRSGVVRLIID